MTTQATLEQQLAHYESSRRGTQGSCNAPGCNLFGTIGRELHGVIRSVTTDAGTVSLAFVLCDTHRHEALSEVRLLPGSTVP